MDSIDVDPVETVLFSEDLFSEALWPWLDNASKIALRLVCGAMRTLVDGSVRVVTVSGFSADQLSRALTLWPGVSDLTLLRLSNATVASTLQPLATAKLSRLTSLTMREAPAPSQPNWWLDQEWQTPAPGDPAWPMPMLSNAMSATLRVIDVACCHHLCSIDAVRSCLQLRVLWMPECMSVSDLSPLAACAELEELWMAGNEQIKSLAPLKACLRLRELDLFCCDDDVLAQVQDLRLTCTQLAQPSMAELGTIYSSTSRLACKSVQHMASYA